VAYSGVLLSSAMIFVAAQAAMAAKPNTCLGQPPSVGAVVHGPVLDIPDRLSLCVARGASPSTWVAVQLPSLGVTRAALMAAAFGKTATCVVAPSGRADCMIEGRRLADELQRPEVIKAASAWR
jgi:hypothetical protein